LGERIATATAIVATVVATTAVAAA